MLTSLGQVLAPTRCVACGGRSAPPWCGACRALAERADPDGCTRCGDPWPGHPCPARGTCWRGSVAVWRHRGTARDVVAVAKARGAWAGWERLGREVAEAVAGASWAPIVDAVTWVPGRVSVVRRRGIDHARVLAEPVARLLDLPLLPLLVAGRSAGRRVGGARSTVDAGPPFALREDHPELPASLLLVDDVLTTGATVRSVLDALGGIGRPGPDTVVRDVRVATWTRAGSDHEDA